MKESDYEKRFDQLARIKIPAGTKVEIRTGHPTVYTTEGEWEDRGEPPFTPESILKEIPEEFREGIALSFFAYMNEHVKLFCDELFSAANPSPSTTNPEGQ